MIGISWYFGFDINPIERAKLLKEYGFDCVITNTDKKFNKQNGKFKKQIKLFKDFGLKHSSLHMQYKSCELAKFWQHGKCGDKMLKSIIQDIKMTKKHGFTCLVVHLKGSFSKVGISRLYKVLDACEKYGVDIAVENLDNEKVFFKVMDTINHPNLKFCYDSGHHNIWMKNIDLLEKYGNRLVALHLHNNMGKYDSHSLSKQGTVDWDKLAQKLANLPQVNLDYELLMKEKSSKMSADKVLKECLKEARHLQERIEYYKNKT